MAALTSSMLLLFTVVISVLIYRKTYHEGTSKTSNGLTCAPRECITNVQTGIKRCPVDEDPHPYDPKNETCNPQFACTSNRTPYPVTTNGATMQGEHCEPGVTCSCSSRQMCSRDRLTVFQLSGDAEDLRILPVKNDVSTTLPSGYSLLCQVPQALSEVALGCSISNKTELFDCLSGKNGSKSCPYGVATCTHGHGWDPETYVFRVLHRPCGMPRTNHSPLRSPH